jgi:hypothetical protein
MIQSTYDTIIVSLIINYGDTSAFCMHKIYDTIYDISIVASLNHDLDLVRLIHAWINQ